MAIRTSAITDSYIYAVTIRQLLGLENERDSLIEQVCALVDEKKELYNIIADQELEIAFLQDRSKFAKDD